MQLDPTRILQDLKATYWFLPSCMATLAIALSFLMPWLDTQFSVDPGGAYGWIGQTQTDGARSVLGAIAGSIIGVAGTTFSITIVAVSFASANFGPRLIANFMRDRGNQLTLGTFIATFVYSLLVLRRVHNAAGEDGSASYEAFVPHLSVIVALLLALACVGVLIYFIHHVPETINIDRLVAGIGRHLRRSVTDLFPETDEDVRPEDVDAWRRRVASRHRVPVTASKTGFVQRVDTERLGELAESHSAIVRVQYRPGDFVVDGDTLFELWIEGEPDRDETDGDEPDRDERDRDETDGDETDGDERDRDEPDRDGSDGGERDADAPDEPPLDEMRACFETGYQRTPDQDCLFLADQLVEVIGRAMSPGINDPFTATTCLGWLKGALIEFVERDAERPRPYSSGPVVVRPIEFERMLAVAFDRTRQYVCADRDVALHSMAALAEIGVRTTRTDHRDAVRRRMDELRAASVAALAAEVGGDDVARRHAEAVRLLHDPAARERRLDDTGWFGGSG